MRRSLPVVTGSKASRLELVGSRRDTYTFSTVFSDSAGVATICRHIPNIDGCSDWFRVLFHSRPMKKPAPGSGLATSHF